MNSVKGNAQPVSSVEGIVNVPLADVLEHPAWGSERVTQVRWGESLMVYGKRNEWYKVRVVNQERDDAGYPGWIQQSSVVFGLNMPEEKCWRVKSVRAVVRDQPDDFAHKLFMLYSNSKVELLHVQGDWAEVHLPEHECNGWIRRGELLADFLPASGESLVREARRFLGVPYLWGGMSVLGIDCSGLIYVAYERHGLILPRDADEQFLCGQAVEDGAWEPGDLLFFGRDEGHVTHVGMYVGDDHFIHAAGRRGCCITTLSASEQERNYLGARRIL